MSKIIVINGMAMVGKDTFVNLCHEINQNIIQISTIDFVKSVAKFAGWNGVKDEKSRKFLSDLKDILEEYNDIPNKKIDEFISARPNNIIFIHAREPHNIAYYKEKYNAVTLLITNPNVKTIISNHADKNVFNYDYDYIIENNNTLAELKNKAREFLKKIEIDL